MSVTTTAQTPSLAGAPTCELQWELERREGVTAFSYGPEHTFKITVDGETVHEGRSPCTLTVNID